MITYLINALNHPLFAIIASYKMIICFMLPTISNKSLSNERNDIAWIPCSLTSKGKINGDAVSAPTVACGLANCEYRTS